MRVLLQWGFVWGGGTNLVHSSRDWTSICWKVQISSRLPKIRATSELLSLRENENTGCVRRNEHVQWHAKKNKVKGAQTKFVVKGVHKIWLIQVPVTQQSLGNNLVLVKLYVLMSSTCQCSEELAGSSSGGSEGPWSILSLFLKCSATPTIQRRKKSFSLDISNNILFTYTKKSELKKHYQHINAVSIHLKPLKWLHKHILAKYVFTSEFIRCIDTGTGRSHAVMKILTTETLNLNMMLMQKGEKAAQQKAIELLWIWDWSDKLRPYQVIVCFADCRCVKAFRRTLQSATLGRHLFVCDQRQKNFIRAPKSTSHYRALNEQKRCYVIFLSWNLNFSRWAKGVRAHPIWSRCTSLNVHTDA